MNKVTIILMNQGKKVNANVLVKISNAPCKCLFYTVPNSNYFDHDND